MMCLYSMLYCVLFVSNNNVICMTRCDDVVCSIVDGGTPVICSISIFHIDIALG